MKSSRSDDFKYDNSFKSRQFLYDARGERVKPGLLSNKYIRALLFYVLPYIVINGIILILVCARPSVSINVQETTDFVSSEVDFTVNSILPIRGLDVSLESEPLEYEKSGNTYKATVYQNGTLMVHVTSINGMQVREFVDIGLLDTSSPTVDSGSADASGGVLRFSINDSQSGVNYDSIYAVSDLGENLRPSEIDETLGNVTIDIPQGTGSLDIYYADKVGNEGSSHINLIES